MLIHFQSFSPGFSMKFIKHWGFHPFSSIFWKCLNWVSHPTVHFHPFLDQGDEHWTAGHGQGRHVWVAGHGLWGLRHVGSPFERFEGVSLEAPLRLQNGDCWFFYDSWWYFEWCLMLMMLFFCLELGRDSDRLIFLKCVGRTNIPRSRVILSGCSSCHKLNTPALAWKIGRGLCRNPSPETCGHEASAPFDIMFEVKLTSILLWTYINA